MSKQISRIQLPPWVHLLDEQLWQGGGRPGRSMEITPLFIERYHGVRAAKACFAHDCWELTCVLQGEETLHFGERLLLRPHSVCLIPARVPHREASTGPVDTIWIGFRGTRLPAGILKRPQVVESKALTGLIEQLWLFAEAAFGPAGPELDALTAHAVSRFLRLLAEGSTEKTGNPLERAVEFLARHYAETVHMAAVARRFGYSEGYFYRRFKKHTGIAPNAYLTRLRLQHATRLLRESSLPVKEIAARVGLTDEAYFSRVFKKFAGQSPVQFRQRGRGRAERAVAREGAQSHVSGIATTWLTPARHSFPVTGP